MFSFCFVSELPTNQQTLSKHIPLHPGIVTPTTSSAMSSPGFPKKHKPKRGLEVKPGETAPLMKVVLGDEKAYVDRFNQTAIEIQKLTDSEADHHDCNPSCLLKSELVPEQLSAEEQLKKLRGISNPFLTPMLLYGFVRTALVLKPTARCRLCEALEPAEGCPRLHIAYVTPCGKVLWCPDHVRDYLLATSTPDTAFYFNENYFTFSMLFQLKQVIQEAYEYVPDISYGKETVPVSLVNTVKGLEKPKFSYICERVWDPELFKCSTQENKLLPENPKMYFHEFKSCCSCKDNCNSDKCECKLLTVNENCQKPTYKNRRLYRHMRRGVFECNSECPCNAACSNRVSQNGLVCRLQFFPCGKKGWGIRTLHFIPKGMFIGLYHGRIIQAWQINPRDQRQSQFICDLIDNNENHDSEDEREHKRQMRVAKRKATAAKKAIAAAKAAGATPDEVEAAAKAAAAAAEVSDTENDDDDDNYEDGPGLKREELFKDLDNYRESDFLVDGSVQGNVTRSMNHSCAPNCFSQPIFTETHDIRFPEMALFAARDIHPMEELCWNYSYRLGKDHNRVLYCQCSTLNCILRLI